MLTDLLFAEGVSPWWYTLLCLELAPFVLMVLQVLRPGREAAGPRESVLLSGAVLAAAACMILTSLWAAVLFVRVVPSPPFLRWVAALGAHFLVWASFGSAMLFAAFHALGPGAPMGTRRRAAAGATALAVLLQGATMALGAHAWPR